MIQTARQNESARTRLARNITRSYRDLTMWLARRSADGIIDASLESFAFHNAEVLIHTTMMHYIYISSVRTMPNSRNR